MPHASQEPVAGKQEQAQIATAALLGLCAAAAVFVWLFLNVHYLFGGNWTSIYYSGEQAPAPPAELAHEHIYRFPGVSGYDAQFYHYMAHDPLFRRGFATSIDMPRTRYRRILVSGLAALLSFGQQNWVDPAYLFVMLSLIFLGTFWLARWCSSHGFPAYWGLLFLILPATLVSALTMVIDLAVATLTVGILWYAERRRPVSLWIVLAGVALARETGFLVVAGYCLYVLLASKQNGTELPLAKRFWRSAAFGTAIIPGALWLLFVQMHTEAYPLAWMSLIPVYAIYRGFVHHFAYGAGLSGRGLLGLDWLALSSMIVAFGVAFYYSFRQDTWRPGTFIAFVLAVFAMFLSANDSIWPEVNSYSRNFTPLLLVIGTTGALRGNWWPIALTLLIDGRISTVFAVHAARIVKAMLHGG